MPHDTYPGYGVYPGVHVYPHTSPDLIWQPTLREQSTEATTETDTLRYHMDVASTVWKDQDGVWHDQEVPYDGDLAAAQVVLRGPLDLIYQSDLVDELTAAGIGTITEE